MADDLLRNQIADRLKAQEDGAIRDRISAVERDVAVQKVVVEKGYVSNTEFHDMFEEKMVSRKADIQESEIRTEAKVKQLIDQQTSDILNTLNQALSNHSAKIEEAQRKGRDRVIQWIAALALMIFGSLIFDRWNDIIGVLHK